MCFINERDRARCVRLFITTTNAIVHHVRVVSTIYDSTYVMEQNKLFPYFRMGQQRSPQEIFVILESLSRDIDYVKSTLDELVTLVVRLTEHVSLLLQENFVFFKLCTFCHGTIPYIIMY